MRTRKPVSIGLIWAQFAAYHVDRCEAVARRIGEHGEVVAIEVATTSVDYAWEPSDAVAGARKLTLFSGRSFDSIHPLKRFWAMLGVTRHCNVVCVGLSYGLLDSILLSWALRLLGKRVVVFSETKFDDCRRNVWFELGKSLILSAYTAAIVGGSRHMAYFRFLGFRNRPVIPGYDSVGVERIRRQGGGANQAALFASRHFLFVGRFVGKKNLFTLMRAYARYRQQSGEDARRLQLVGSGQDEDGLRKLGAELGIADMIDFPGFLSADAVSRSLAGALALVLVSGEEQWGLVVNEALALNLPVIVSDEVGSRDLLVRNLVNGFVVESNCVEGIARAMLDMASDQTAWEAMAKASQERAWMGDVERLADAIELLLNPGSESAAFRIQQLKAEMEIGPK